MPARKTLMKAITTVLACALWGAPVLAQSQESIVQPLPSLVQERASAHAWPQASDGSTWVPVFMLGDNEGLLAGPFASDAPGNVLLGIAQVRGQSYSGQDTVAISPSLR